jgi:hypothetical protein
VTRKVSGIGIRLSGFQRGVSEVCGNRRWGAMLYGARVGKTTFWTPSADKGREVGGGERNLGPLIGKRVVLSGEICVNIMCYKKTCLVNFSTLNKNRCHVSTRSHLWIVAEVSPIPINFFYVIMNNLKGGLMDAKSGGLVCIGS